MLFGRDFPSLACYSCVHSSTPNKVTFPVFWVGFLVQYRSLCTGWFSRRGGILGYCIPVALRKLFLTSFLGLVLEDVKILRRKKIWNSLKVHCRWLKTFLCICSYGSKSDTGYHFWGQGNLQAPLRTLSESSSPNVASSLELRQFDGCSNPHLGLAAILASGIDGLRKHIHVPPPLGTTSCHYFSKLRYMNLLINLTGSIWCTRC